MGTTALVSGSTDRLRAVVPALEHLGFDVIVADHVDRIGELGAVLGPEALDCYIQLPFEVNSEKITLIDRTRAFLTGGLLSRFVAAAAAIPMLRCGATVVLVTGHEPPGDVPDDPRARRDLLSVLARAIAGEAASLGVRTALVGSTHSADDIAAVAGGHGHLPWPDASTGAFAGSYDDWRRDVLSSAVPDVRTWLPAPAPEDYDW